MTPPQLPHGDLLADTGRPLLQLVQHLTGMETSFITAIHWENQHQDVVLSLNSGSIAVQEGGRVDWNRSLCRSMLLAGRLQSADLLQEIAGTEPARELGIRSFFALPIVVGDHTIGTLCGASARQVALSEHQLASLELIATSLRQQLHTRLQLVSAQASVDTATREVAHAQRAAEQLRESAQKLDLLSRTDPLTGLLNRRGFTSRWEEELARSARRAYTLSVLLIDIDRFKAVNDTSGHAAGDAVLVALAATLRSISTSADIAARLGGDEFALAITHLTAESALNMAARLQQHFAGLMREAVTPDVTLSIGVAISAVSARHDLLAAADRALYASKARGGDCAQLAEHDVDV